MRARTTQCRLGFGIVAQSGGQVQVETAPGRGSTFRVDLPRVVGKSAAAKPTLVERIRRGSGTILLAEDDPAVRLFARRSLESAGYTVYAAPGAEDAIKASEHWSSSIEVLVSDVGMPGMHGHERFAAQDQVRRQLREHPLELRRARRRVVGAVRHLGHLARPALGRLTGRAGLPASEPRDGASAALLRVRETGRRRFVVGFRCAAAPQV